MQTTGIFIDLMSTARYTSLHCRMTSQCMQKPTIAPSLAGRCSYITNVAIAQVAVLRILECLLGLEGMDSTLRPNMGKVLIPNLHR